MSRSYSGYQMLGQWAVFLLCCILLYLVILISMVLEEVKIERERQEVKSYMLERQYQELLEIHREHGILVHDVKNHMRMIEAMIEHGRTEEAAAYISRILGELSRGRDVIWSNHESMNLILNMKFREARKAQIRVECHCDDMSGLALSLVKICALFSNLLDNAIEANKKCPADMERRIVLICARREKMLMISLSNPAEQMRTGQRKRLLETTKEDGKLHGFGMLSVQKVIDNHHGHMRVDVKEKEFSIVIYLAAFRE
ncbi:MAG: sensor histidine kinase [Lachnospiraceae bacterium]|nr:sensor histidine kinase [Lachnospiraceae bacterium]